MTRAAFPPALSSPDLPSLTLVGVGATAFTTTLWLAVEALAFARVALAVAVGRVRVLEDADATTLHMMTVDPRLTWHWPAIAGAVLLVLLALAAVASPASVRPSTRAALLLAAHASALGGFALSWCVFAYDVHSAWNLTFALEPGLRATQWLTAALAVLALCAAALAVRHRGWRAWRLPLAAWSVGGGLLALSVALDVGDVLAIFDEPLAQDERLRVAVAASTSSGERVLHIGGLAAMTVSALVIAAFVWLAQRRTRRVRLCARAFALTLAALPAIGWSAARAAVLAGETSRIPPRSPLDSLDAPNAVGAVTSPWPRGLQPLTHRGTWLVIDGERSSAEGLVCGEDGIDDAIVDAVERAAAAGGRARLTLVAASHVPAGAVAERFRHARAQGIDVTLAFASANDDERPLLGRTRVVHVGTSPVLTERLLADDPDPARPAEGESFGAWAARTTAPDGHADSLTPVALPLSSAP